jgi:hypothetical protein
MSTPAANQLDLASTATFMRVLSTFSRFIQSNQGILIFEGIALVAAKAAERNPAMQQLGITTYRYESGCCS